MMSRRTIALLATTLLGAGACSKHATSPTTPNAAGQAPVAAPSASPSGLPMQTAQPQELQFPEEDFRKTQPAPSEIKPFQFPEIKAFTLKSGLRAHLVENHDLPIAAISLSFVTGSADDPQGKEGLADLCSDLLTEGTAKLDKVAYSEAQADLAAEISAYASRDSFGVTVSMLSKHSNLTVDLLAETLLTPGLRQADFERLQKRHIEALRQRKSTPDAIAPRVAAAVLNGRTHGYGRLATEASLAAVTLDDCRSYLTRVLKPGGADLFAVGDLNEAQLRNMFSANAFASWSGKAPSLGALAKPQPAKGKIFFVHAPGAAQSAIRFDDHGPLRTAKDYFATNMLAAIYGGSFSSRVNMNLREDKGYTYGARGGFGYQRKLGAFSTSASIRADATYQALLEVQRELGELLTGKRPVTDVELGREKNGAILGLPGSFATASSALSEYAGLAYYGLPLDYYKTYTSKLNLVTPADVQAAAKRHLRPEAMRILVVGDGAAELKLRNAEGKDMPWLKDGKPVTLRQALIDAAAQGVFGKGDFVELNADALPVTK